MPAQSSLRPQRAVLEKSAGRVPLAGIQVGVRVVAVEEIWA